LVVLVVAVVALAEEAVVLLPHQKDEKQLLQQNKPTFRFHIEPAGLTMWPC